MTGARLVGARRPDFGWSVPVATVLLSVIAHGVSATDGGGVANARRQRG
jgi:hypothetical protein